MARHKGKIGRGGGGGGKGARGGARAGGAGAGTQLELAAVHGVSQQAVSKWIRDPRWRAAGFSRVGPWGVKEIARQRAWRVDVLREDPNAGERAAADDRELERAAGGAAAPNDLGRLGKIAGIKKLVAQEEAIRLDMAIKLGQFIKRTEADERQAAKARAVRTALQQIPKALRQILADAVDPGRVEEILSEALRRVCVDGFER